MSESQDDPQYVLDPAELAFLKTETGIQDDDALKAHVLAIQKKAYEVYPYPCIRLFGFVRLKINQNRAAYEHVLILGRDIPDALLLDIGCCVGNDLRKIASEGFPVQNIVGTDLRQEFWDLGHELFRSTAASFPATFLAGDAFDPEFLSVPPLSREGMQRAISSNLGTVKSLNDLHGRFSAIHCASLFPHFSEEEQFELAHKLAGLLSPRAGSMIFGSHGAQLTKGYSSAWGEKRIFYHSPESWREMWDGVAFERGSVEVQTELKNLGRVLNSTSDLHVMFWSVRRM
ncbi:hypothetical protein MVEN_00972800 [Mycena venus]|uniref:Methyltransferase domain-containing protein n=1 Tax=Mycena venus TaxID=2733690 RepID=A0A8H6YC48_9AGAR|nr:hypothetical protein MVEN_00972800 [Mycena venus]